MICILSLRSDILTTCTTLESKLFYLKLALIYEMTKIIFLYIINIGAGCKNIISICCGYDSIVFQIFPPAVSGTHNNEP